MKPARFEVAILGAGAAGLLAALTAARRGRRVLLLDHARRPGAKIRVSGGGRCNFTHLHASPKHYLSQQPNFCRAALKAFPPQRFLDEMRCHGLTWHEKSPGQLFGDGPAEGIVSMLEEECRQAGVEFRLGVTVEGV
ncbi:MAG: FAD-dependent oxidoreductase, partial [Magnetococcales bacterium]|nr:FAD-dependent oxidoreductase [Magnetococcales bacterium]